MPSPGIQSQRELDVDHRWARPSSRAVGLSSGVYRKVGRTSWVRSTLHGLGLANWPPRYSRRSADRVHKAPSRPPVDLGSAPECDPRGPLPKQLPLVRFGSPTTLEARGSDLHRACLTRLCDASRLLPPLGVLLLPRPSRLCFTPVTPLGFPLQRFSPPARPARSLDRPAPLDVTRPNNAAGEAVRFVGRLPGRDRNAPEPSPLLMSAP